MHSARMTGAGASTVRACPAHDRRGADQMYRVIVVVPLVTPPSVVALPADAGVVRHGAHSPVFAFEGAGLVEAGGPAEPVGARALTRTDADATVGATSHSLARNCKSKLYTMMEEALVDCNMHFKRCGSFGVQQGCLPEEALVNFNMHFNWKFGCSVAVEKILCKLALNEYNNTTGLKLKKLL